MSVVDTVKALKEKLDGIDEAVEYVSWADKQLKDVSLVLRTLEKSSKRVKTALNEATKAEDLRFISDLVTDIVGLRLSVRDRLVKISRKASTLLQRIRSTKGKDRDLNMAQISIQKVKTAVDRTLSEYADVLRAIDRLQAWVRKERRRKVAAFAGGIAAAVVGGIALKLVTDLLTGGVMVQGMVSGIASILGVTKGDLKSVSRIMPRGAKGA